MNNDNNVPRWTVPGSSGGSYTVTLKGDGTYTCACWPFRKARTCKHIQAVIDGDPGVAKMKDEPDIQFAQVAAVTPAPDKDNVLLVPLVPFGDAHLDFAITVCYDLLQAGVRWKTVKARYNLAVKEADLLALVRRNGYRTVLDESSWVDGHGYTRYINIPLPETQGNQAR